MSKFYWRYLLLGVLLLSLVPLTTISNAQDDTTPERVLNRIDQAMEHLNGYLGRTDINRSTAFWEWREVIYPDTSLNCPAPGQSYTQVQTRGYEIKITLRTGEYDYRLSSDGSILVLCINNAPAQAVAEPTPAPGVSTPLPATTTNTTQVISLPTSSWWAWAYSPNTDHLYLLNQSGLAAEMSRPKVPNEAADATFNPYSSFTISRDGRFMLMVSTLTSGVKALGIYSFENGTFTRVHQASVNEEIYLGGTLTFHPTLPQVAVGYATLNYDNPTTTQWRVVVYDLTSGSPLYQIAQNSSLLTSLPSEYQSLGLNFPTPIYYDGNSVHFYIVFVGGGASSYPTVSWNPMANTVTRSGFFVTGLDILPTTQQAVFSYRDTAFTALEPNGPFESHNAIAVGTPELNSTVWVDGTRYHFTTKWAASGAIVLFSSSDTTNVSQWNALNLSTNVNSRLPATIVDVDGLPNGFLTLSDTGFVSFTDQTSTNYLVGTPVWQTPDTNTFIFWTYPAGTAFTLTKLTATLTENPTYCSGAPPSIVQVGIQARVTLSDGTPLPLRVRDMPGGAFLLSMEEGTTFSVIGGPQCQGGFTWWQVRTPNGTTGWSAEGDLNTYFMEPAP